MKKALLMVVFSMVGSTAFAYQLVADPSGAPMCFDADGAKAPRSACAPQRSFVKMNDPSGAPMCFNEFGAKAPLSACSTPSSLDLLVSN